MKQVVKVIWHTATSLLHMDGSIVFTRFRQCAPHLVHQICICTTAVLPPAESLSVYQPLRMSWAPQNCPYSFGNWSGPHLIHGSLEPTESTHQAASRSVHPYCGAHDRDRLTDRPRYSVCDNRLHLCSNTMHNNNNTSHTSNNSDGYEANVDSA